MRKLTLFSLLLAVLFALLQPSHASASLSSGLPGGPVGTPVISTQAYTVLAPARTALVVGDSITVRSYKALAAQLSLHGQRLAVNAQSGRNTRLSVDALLAQMKGVPDSAWPSDLIMATGANDVFAPGAMLTQVPRLLAAVPKHVRVHWVTVYVARPAYLLADKHNSYLVNQAITTGCAASPRCSLVRWAAFLTASTPRLRADIDTGGVHPTAAGRLDWGKLLASAVPAAPIGA